MVCRFLFIFLLCPFVICGTEFCSGQEDDPFGNYPDTTTTYLKRIQFGKQKFAFGKKWKEDFLGWQKASRKTLADRCGLTRMAGDLKNHIVTMSLLERVESRDDDAPFERLKGSLETEPGIQIPFYILIPNGEGPFPLAICPHGHDTLGWHSYAGAYRNAKHKKEILSREGNIAEQLAKKGFIAIAPAARGLAKEVLVKDIKGRHGNRDCRAQLMHCLISGRTPVAERVWDLQRIIDWALLREDVDPSRIVMVGNSGGGVATAYAAALDTRIKVAIPSCSFTSITSSNGYIFHCDCCAIPGILDWGDMSDVGGLIAPRSLLIVHGEKDGLHQRADVERNAAKVKKIFAAANAAASLQVAWGKGGHRFYPDIILPFIEEQLK